MIIQCKISAFIQFINKKRQMHLQLPILIVLFLVIPHGSASLKIPERSLSLLSFGLILTTHRDQHDQAKFQLFLSHYASMKCEPLAAITVIWYYSQSPAQLQMSAKSMEWNRPVNFQLAPRNSANWHYKISPRSQDQVYLSIKENNFIDCSQMKNGFKIWQSHALGQIGPIVSYKSGVFEYSNRRGFTGMTNQQNQFFSVGSLTMAFISRHFMELYYSNSWELQQMRKVVEELNDCNEIGLNWLVQYYYPQLKTVIISNSYEENIKDMDNAQNTGQCIQKFTRIFGINPLRYSPIIDTYGDQIRFLALKNESVLEKRQYLEKELLNKIDKLPESKPRLEKLLVSRRNSQKEMEDINLKLKQQAQHCNQSLIQSTKEIPIASHPPARLSNHKLAMQLRQELAMTVFIELGLISTLLILLWKLIAACLNRPSHASSPLPEAEEPQIVIISQ